MHVEYYEHILQHPGIDWGVSSMDSIVIPMRPGDLTVLCGRPGSGKTSILARQAKRIAQDIAQRNAQKEECVIYVSWEQHAEELEAYFQSDKQYTHTDYAWGRVDIKDVRAKTFTRASLPLWVIGHSRKNVVQQVKPLTLDLVFDAVESMAHTYKAAPKPVLLCFDYAQVMEPSAHKANRYLEVKDLIKESKNLALRCGCPIMLGAQAGRQVDSYKYPVPSMNDGQETSGLEQVPDKFFGLWRPWKTNPHNEHVDIYGHQIQNSPDLMVIKMNKQRGDDGDRIFIVHFDPAELRLDDIELGQNEPPY